MIAIDMRGWIVGKAEVLIARRDLRRRIWMIGNRSVSRDYRGNMMG
jgi:hypothetical protein